VTRDRFFREWIGAPTAPPPPSPGPWTFREASIDGQRGRERVFVILDADGRAVAELDKYEDAAHVAQHGPGPALPPTELLQVWRDFLRALTDAAGAYCDDCSNQRPHRCVAREVREARNAFVAAGGVEAVNRILARFA